MYKITTFFLILFQAVIFGQFNDDMNRYMLAQNYEQSGDLERAKTIYEDLFKRNPENPQFFESLNRTYLGLKNYDGSINIIQNRLSKNPADISLYGMLGSAYYLKGDDNKAFATWDDGIAKSSNNPMSYRVIANYAVERRVFEKAIEYLRKGKQLSQTPLMFSYDLANLYSTTMQYENAANEYLDMIKQDPKQQAFVQQRIFSYTSKPEALKATIKVFEDKGKKDITSAQILAQLYLQGKEFNKGFELYKNLDKQLSANGTELYNFAQGLIFQGEYKVASDIYNFLLKEYPSSPIIPSVKLGYAKTLEAELLNRNAGSGWRTYSISSNIDPNETRKVISAYEEIVKTFPHTEQSYEARYRIGVLYKDMLNETGSAANSLNLLIKEGPVSVYSALAEEKLAEIALETGDLEKSTQLYESIVNFGRLPGEAVSNAKYMLSRVYFFSGSFDNARSTLNSIITEFKDEFSNDAIGLSLILNTMAQDSSNLVKLAQAEFLTAQKKFNDAREIYKELASKEDLLILAGLAKFRMGEMDIALDNYDSAIKVMSEIGEEKEKNIYSDKALYLLGKVYRFAKNDKNKAIEIYEKLLSAFPQSIYLDEVREEINLIRKNS